MKVVKLKPQGPDPSAETFMSADDLCAKTFAPPKFVVPGYIVEGLTLFAGKPKIGKSWLLLHAALAVARSGFTLGDALSQQGDVLYCALEDNARRLQRRLQKLLNGEAAPSRLKFLTEMPRLTQGGLDILSWWISSVPNPRLIVIDVLARVRAARKKDEGLYDADYAAMQGLKALADAHGIAIVVVHHLRKAEADDPLDQISGTTGLAGSADTVFVLHKGKGGTALHGRGRDIEEVEKALQFNKTSCTWTVLGEAIDVQWQTTRTTVLDVLLEAGEPLGPQEVADLANLTLSNARKLLVRMVADGDVRKLGRGRYIHPNRADLAKEGGR